MMFLKPQRIAGGVGLTEMHAGPYRRVMISMVLGREYDNFADRKG